MFTVCTIAPVCTITLERVQIAAARQLLNLGNTDHITDGLKDLHWLSITFRIQYKLCLLMHLIKVGSVHRISRQGYGQPVVLNTFTIRPQIGQHRCIYLCRSTNSYQAGCTCVFMCQTHCLEQTVLGCVFRVFRPLTVVDVVTSMQCMSDPLQTDPLEDNVDVLAPFFIELYNRSFSS
jgi:hypothetical protein